MEKKSYKKIGERVKERKSKKDEERERKYERDKKGISKK